MWRRCYPTFQDIQILNRGELRQNISGWMENKKRLLLKCLLYNLMVYRRNKTWNSFWISIYVLPLQISGIVEAIPRRSFSFPWYIPLSPLSQQHDLLSAYEWWTWRMLINSSPRGQLYISRRFRVLWTRNIISRLYLKYYFVAEWN